MRHCLAELLSEQGEYGTKFRVCFFKPLLSWNFHAATQY
jgi:hypothetical protein